MNPSLRCGDGIEHSDNIPTLAQPAIIRDGQPHPTHLCTSRPGRRRRIANRLTEPDENTTGHRAFDTLIRATRFFAAAVVDPNGAAAGPYPAKVAGNSLRELDRFLNLLLDAVVHRRAPLAFDRPAYVRQRNAANKLRILFALSASLSPDHERLRAIGRTRDCLFHRGGMSGQGHRADLAMATGLHAVAPHAAGLRAHTSLTASDRIAIASFYGRLAADLFDHADGFGAAASDKRVASRR